MEDAAGRVVTVLGPVEPAALGRTLVHEHLFADLRHCSFVDPPPSLARIADEQVGAVDPEILARHSCSVRDNLLLADLDVAIAEVGCFARAGGGAIVDVTPPDLGRAPELLRRVAAATGVSIVMGCGHYCEIGYREPIERLSEEDLARRMVDELLHGVDGTGIRPGIIGELGVNGEERGTRRLVGELTPLERRVLRAGVRASRETGAPLTIHLPTRSSAVPVVLAELESADAPVERISLSHMDSIPDFALHEEALARGLWIHYDCFGMALENDWYSDPGDEQRIGWLLRHLESGRLGRVLVSHDVWCKAQLHAHGGGGYDHLLVEVAPRLAERGFTEADLDRLFRANPARFLAWR